MAKIRYIPESEFLADLSSRLQEMARAVAFSGLTISELAAAARVKWDTVSKVSQGQPVRMDCAARIMYVIKQANQVNNEEK